MSSSLLAAFIFAFSLDSLFSNLPQQVSNHSFISASGGMEEQVRAMEMTDAQFKLCVCVCVCVWRAAFLRERRSDVVAPHEEVGITHVLGCRGQTTVKRPQKALIVDSG